MIHLPRRFLERDFWNAQRHFADGAEIDDVRVDVLHCFSHSGSPVLSANSVAIIGQARRLFGETLHDAAGHFAGGAQIGEFVLFEVFTHNFLH